MIYKIPLLLSWQHNYDYDNFSEREVKVYDVIGDFDREEALATSIDIARKDTLLANKHGGSYPHFICPIEEMPNEDLEKIFSKVRLPYANPDIMLLPETQLKLI